MFLQIINVYGKKEEVYLHVCLPVSFMYYVLLTIVVRNTLELGENYTNKYLFDIYLLVETAQISNKTS